MTKKNAIKKFVKYSKLTVLLLSITVFTLIFYINYMQESLSELQDKQRALYHIINSGKVNDPTVETQISILAERLDRLENKPKETTMIDYEKLKKFQSIKIMIRSIIENKTFSSIKHKNEKYSQDISHDNANLDYIANDRKDLLGWSAWLANLVTVNHYDFPPSHLEQFTFNIAQETQIISLLKLAELVLLLPITEETIVYYNELIDDICVLLARLKIDERDVEIKKIIERLHQEKILQNR